MPFEATLTNGVPPGEIVTSGTFGPWGVDNPGDTPLQGTFTFDNANLDVFPGIGGMLSSKGTFRRIGWGLHRNQNGETDTPDFMVDVGGHPFPLPHQVPRRSSTAPTATRGSSASTRSSSIRRWSRRAPSSTARPARGPGTVTLNVEMSRRRASKT